MTLAVVLITGTTLVVSGWVALAEIRRADAAAMREQATREALAEIADEREVPEVEGISLTDSPSPSGPLAPAPLLWIALAGTLFVTAGAVHVAGVARNRTTPGS